MSCAGRQERCSPIAYHPSIAGQLVSAELSVRLMAQRRPAPIRMSPRRSSRQIARRIISALPSAMRDAGLHWAVNEVHVLWRGYWQLTDRHRHGITPPDQSTPFGARHRG
jgi:hypothetical protein